MNKRTVEELNNLPSFVAWLETQDLDTTYDYCDARGTFSGGCLAYRYFNGESIDGIEGVTSRYVRLKDGEIIPLNGYIDASSFRGEPSYRKALEIAKELLERERSLND
jgi:hypothetical protein